MLDPFGLQVSFNLLRYILAAVVRPQSSNALFTFISGTSFKFFELLKHFRFAIHEIDSTAPVVVIYERDKIAFSPSDSSMGPHTSL